MKPPSWILALLLFFPSLTFADVMLSAEGPVEVEAPQVSSSSAVVAKPSISDGTGHIVDAGGFACQAIDDSCTEDNGGCLLAIQKNRESCAQATRDRCLSAEAVASVSQEWETIKAYYHVPLSSRHTGWGGMNLMGCRP